MLILLSLAATTAQAATVTWAGGGGDTNWSTAANWDSNPTLPGAGDTVVFASGGTAVVIDGAYTVAAVTLSSAADMAISGSDGGSSLTIAGSGGITVGGASNYTWSCPIVLGADQTWNHGGSGVLTIAAAISGAHGLTKSGSGTLRLGIACTYTGATVIAAGTIQLIDLSTTTPANGSVFWLDAANAGSLAVNADGSGGTPAATGSVKRWTSLSGVNFGSNGSSNATYQTGVLNGKPVVRVTGDDSTALSFNNQVTADGTTVFMMFRSDYTSWSQPLQSTGTYLHQTDGDNNGVRCAVSAGGALRIQPNGAKSSDWHVQEVQVQSGNYALWIDNVPSGTNASGVTIGDFINVGGGFGACDLAEVLIYNGTLSASDRNQTYAYLSEKWLNGTGSPSNILPTTTALAIASGATLDLNGGSQQVAALADSSGSGGSVTNNGAFDSALAVNGSTSTAFSGVISDGSSHPVAVIKDGSGTLTVTGSNTYSGATTINGGMLKMTGATFSNAPRAYAIASGAILNLDGNTGAAAGTTTLSGAGTLRITGGVFANESPNVRGPGRNVTIAFASGGLIQVQSGASMTNGGWQSVDWSSNLASLQVDGGFDLWDGNAVRVDALSGSGTITEGLGGGEILVIGVNNGSGTFSGTFSNVQAGLTKQGSGTETCTGSLSYTGPTIVTAGTLDIASGGSLVGTSLLNPISGGAVTIEGTVTIGANGAFAPGTGTAGTSTVTVNSGGVLNMGGGTGGLVGRCYVGGLLDGGGAAGIGILTITSGALVTVDSGGGVSAGDGNCLWLNPWSSSGASTLNLNGGVLSLKRPISDGGGTQSVIDLNGGTLQAAAGNLNLITASGTCNVRNGGAIIDTEAFTTVWVDRSMTHSAVGGDQAIDGGLTKIGTGTLSIYGVNTFTGPTTATAGILIAGNAVSNTSNVVVSNGAAIQMLAQNAFYQTPSYPPWQITGGTAAITGGAHQHFGDLTLTGASITTPGGTAYDSLGNYALGGSVHATGATPSLMAASVGMHLDSNPTITVDSGSELDITGNLRNGESNVPASLTKAGSGVLVLTGNGTYSNGTTISAGTMRLGSSRGLGLGTVNVGSGTTLAINAPVASTGLTLLDANWGADLGQIATLPFAQHVLAANSPAYSAVTAVLYGNGGNGRDNFSQLYTGMLKITTAGTYQFNTTSDDGSVLFIDGQTVVYNNFSQPMTQRSGSAVLTAGYHNLQISFQQGNGGYGLAAQFNGPDTGNAWLDLNTTNAQLTPDLAVGSLVGSGNIQLSTGNLIVGSDDASTAFSGVVASDAGVPAGLLKVGSGTLTLSGANTYAGTTTLATGTLRFANATGAAVQGNVVLAGAAANLFTDQPQQLGPTSTLTFSSYDYAEFMMYGHDQTIAGLFAVNGYAVLENSHSAIGPATASSVLTINQAVDSIFPGIIRDNSGSIDAFTLGLIKNGAGRLTFSATPSYTGDTTVNAGALTFSSSGSWTEGGNLTINGGAYELTGGSTVNWAPGKGISFGANAGTLNLASTNFYPAAAGGGSLTISTAGGSAPQANIIGTDGINSDNDTVIFNVARGASAIDLLMASKISNGGNVQKTGNGILTFSGTSTYVGTTTVSAGRMVVASGGALGDTAISVANNATFATTPGSGAVNLGTTGAGSSGATLTLAAGATYDMADGAVGTCNLQQNASFVSAALTANGAIFGFDLSSTGADHLACTNAATISGTNSIALTMLGSSLTTGGSYDLITAASGLDGGTWVFNGGGATATLTAGSNTYKAVLSATATAVTLLIYPAPVITARQTIDLDANGQIDRILISTTMALNNDFSGVTVAVAGYTVASYAAGPSANSFYAVLTESGSPDTAATPTVRVTVNTSLGGSPGNQLLLTDSSPVTATDAAPPVLLSSTWTDAGTNGVSAGDTLTLTFSESVAATAMVAADLGLPVASDSLSSTTISDQTGTVLTLTLAGTLHLSPGGAYSAAALTAGKPSGIYVASGAHLADLAISPNPALVGNAASAVDLVATPSSLIRIEWNDTHDAVAKTWALGAIDLGGSTVSPTYTIFNAGYSTVALGIACSDSTAWTVQSAAASSRFAMKADADGSPGFEITLANAGTPLATSLISGALQDFALQFTAPTSSTTSAGQAITVTVTASQF